MSGNRQKWQNNVQRKEMKLKITNHVADYQEPYLELTKISGLPVQMLNRTVKNKEKLVEVMIEMRQNYLKRKYATYRKYRKLGDIMKTTRAFNLPRSGVMLF